MIGDDELVDGLVQFVLIRLASGYFKHFFTDHIHRIKIACYTGGQAISKSVHFYQVHFVDTVVKN